MNYCIATEQEWPQLAQMRWDFRSEEEETPQVGHEEFVVTCMAFLKRGHDSRSWTYWIAKEGKKVISHIFLHTIQPVPRPKRLKSFYGYVTNVYTRPGYRNRGIGTKLLQHVKTWAAEQDFLLLFVSPSEASVPFYQRAGFRGDTDWMNLELGEY